MSRKNLPAWQQVVQIALNNVPERDNGRDAWEKLNEEERSAVMDFLTEHCGEEAPAKLEETCGKIKHPQWWVWFWVIFSMAALFAVGFLLVDWWESWTDMQFAPFLWLLVCPLNMHTAWKGNPAGKAQEIWKTHNDTYSGTERALDEMLREYTAPRKARMNKGMFVFWLVMLVLWGFLVAWEIADNREPSVSSQIVSVLEDAADGKAGLEDVLLLFEPLEYGQAEECLQAAWDKTAQWSDERYLAAALAVRLGLETAPDYAREALLTTRLGAIDTPAESAEFAAMLALCDAETVQSVRARVEAVEFPEKPAVLAALE